MIVVASFGCKSNPPVQKCNGDYICRCESCDKICKTGDQFCRKLFKSGCECHK